MCNKRAELHTIEYKLYVSDFFVCPVEKNYEKVGFLKNFYFSQKNMLHVNNSFRQAMFFY